MSPLFYKPDIKVLMVYGTIDNVVPYFQAEMLVIHCKLIMQTIRVSYVNKWYNTF
ncbi:MAG: hypothetical protein R2777_10440 [Chitinophagales bacterium]